MIRDKMLTKLPNPEVERMLTQLAGWRIDDGKLYREFSFESFASAFGFIASIAIFSESMNHHPEWLNVHSTVKVWLTSHEIGGISEQDVELAKKIDHFFDRK